MKTLVTTALLLALIFPATAKARDLSDLRKWQDLDFRCHDAPVADDEELDAEITQKDYDKTKRGKTCLAAKALKKKLTYAAKANPRDFSDIRKWKDLNEECTYGKPTQEGCDAAEALGKKLVARGYCLYGHGDVGKASGEHCYLITNWPKRRD